MSRNLRFISLLNRSFTRSHSSIYRNDGSVKIKRVRFVRPILSMRRFSKLTPLLTSLAIYLYVVGEAIDSKTELEDDHQAIAGPTDLHKAKEKDETVKDGSDQDENEEEVDIPDEPPEDAWFIPLGWARQCPPVHYKGTDPEWRSFVDFANDRKRVLSVQNELAGEVSKYLGGLQNFQNLLGTPIQAARYWLDIDAPYGPPPEYERGGIEITDDYIAWTVRPVDPLNISRLQGALWPKPMFSSLWATYSVLWSLQMAKLKSALNIKTDAASKGQQVNHKPISFHRLSQANDKAAPQITTGIQASSNVKTPEVSAPKTSSKSEITDGTKLLRALPSIPQPNEEMTSALTTFKRTFAREWKPAAIPPPRGTLVVSGLVEVRGPNGRCVLEVLAAYHPAESRWVSLAMGVRRIHPKKKGPKGGR